MSVSAAPAAAPVIAALPSAAPAVPSPSPLRATLAHLEETLHLAVKGTLASVRTWTSTKGIEATAAAAPAAASSLPRRSPAHAAPRPASVTYRPPMRDEECSALGGCSTVALSLDTQTLPPRRRERSGEEDGVNEYDDNEEEQSSAQPLKTECTRMAHVPELTLHGDTCSCDTELPRIVELAAVTDASTDGASAAPDARDASTTPEISLRFHSASTAHSLLDISDSSDAKRVCSPPVIASTLHPEWIVSEPSPELLRADLWHDSELPYASGLLVPCAPRQLCTCAFPWRSHVHLMEKHLQPPELALNVRFEGNVYPNWRGAFYANGEPLSALRGVAHELAFVATTLYSIFVFRSCSSAASWVAASIYLVSAWMLYACSSQFHRRTWSLRVYNQLKRVDHCCIMILAAGSCTPSALLMITDPQGVDHGGVHEAGIALLAWGWAGALSGCVYSAFKSLSGHVSVLGLVWMGVVGACMVPFVWHCWLVMLPLEFYSVIAAWMLYLVAIIIYSKRYFDFAPSIFGYHDMMHLLTVVGAIPSMIFNASIIARL